MPDDPASAAKLGELAVARSRQLAELRDRLNLPLGPEDVFFLAASSIVRELIPPGKLTMDTVDRAHSAALRGIVAAGSAPEDPEISEADLLQTEDVFAIWRAIYLQWDRPKTSKAEAIWRIYEHAIVPQEIRKRLVAAARKVCRKSGDPNLTPEEVLIQASIQSSEGLLCRKEDGTFDVRDLVLQSRGVERRSSRHLTVELTVDPAGDERQPIEVLEGLEAAQAVRGYRETLSDPAELAALEWRFGEGTQEECARRHGVTRDQLRGAAERIDQDLRRRFRHLA